VKTPGGEVMRGKDYNVGLRGVLFDARHYERMGAALWLYGWLVLRQTHQQGEIGFVLGGTPISYREIEEETGFNIRTLERWMRALRRQGYIETETAPAGVMVRIMKAKKFPQAGRKFADGVRKPAGRAAHSRVASDGYLPRSQADVDRIGSSCIARSQERARPVDFHKEFHSQPKDQMPQHPSAISEPSGLGQSKNQGQRPETGLPAEPHLQQPNRFFLEARLRQQLLRAEREDAVRRELAVGSGPEVLHR
jgi:hypothetical protein